MKRRKKRPDGRYFPPTVFSENARARCTYLMSLPDYKGEATDFYHCPMGRTGRKDRQMISIRVQKAGSKGCGCNLAGPKSWDSPGEFTMPAPDDPLHPVCVVAVLKGLIK